MNQFPGSDGRDRRASPIDARGAPAGRNVSKAVCTGATPPDLAALRSCGRGPTVDRISNAGPRSMTSDWSSLARSRCGSRSCQEVAPVHPCPVCSQLSLPLETVRMRYLGPNFERVTARHVHLRSSGDRSGPAARPARQPQPASELPAGMHWTVAGANAGILARRAEAGAAC